MKDIITLSMDSLEVLKEMTLEQKGILFDAIYNFHLGKEVELDFSMKMAFAPFKNQFIKDNKKPKKEGVVGKKFDPFLCLKNDFEIDEVLVRDFLEVRKSKKAPLTQTALTAIVNECQKHNFNLSDALRVCCEKNWIGFKYEWYLNIKNQNNGRVNANHQNYNKSGVWDAEKTAIDAIAKLRHRREATNN